MLGNVEVRQWVEGIPIAITVLVRSPITWSEDNNIAVVTQLGTYIFVSYLACISNFMFLKNVKGKGR